MKLKRFQEHVDNIQSKQYIKFNENEIKYMKDRGVFLTGYEDFYLNYRAIRKLSDGNYLVVHPQIECNTIQSLLKYTKETMDKVYQYLLKRYNNSQIIKKQGIYEWYYDGEEWAYQPVNLSKTIFLSSKDFIEMICNKFNISEDELNIILNSRLKMNIKHD